jgi:hypothetical protein
VDDLPCDVAAHCRRSEKEEGTDAIHRLSYPSEMDGLAHRLHPLGRCRGVERRVDHAGSNGVDAYSLRAQITGQMPCQVMNERFG